MKTTTIVPIKKTDILQGYMNQKLDELVTQELEVVYQNKKTLIIPGTGDNEWKVAMERKVSAEANIKNIMTVLSAMQDLMKTYMKEEASGFLSDTPIKEAQKKSQ